MQHDDDDAVHVHMWEYNDNSREVGFYTCVFWREGGKEEKKKKIHVPATRIITIIKISGEISSQLFTV